MTLPPGFGSDFVANAVMPNHADVLTVDFSSDSTVLCLGTSENTVVQLFAHKQYKQSSTILNSAMTAGEDLKAPPVCIRFQPEPNLHEGQAKNLALIACVDGGLSHWHLNSGRRLQSANFPDSPNYAIDYSPLNDTVVVGGDDGLVRVLDAHRLSTVVEVLQPSINIDWTPHGSQRILSMKHVDPHVVATGGWSRCVKFWDRRAGRPVATIRGPYICGDGIDVAGTLLVTASYREEKPLELWDVRNLESPVLKCIEVPPVMSDDERRSVSMKSFKRGANPLMPVPSPVTAKPQEGTETSSAEPSEEAPVTSPAPIHKPSLFTAKFHPSGNRILVGGNFGQLHYFDVNGEEITLESKSIHVSKGIAAASLLTQSHSIFTLAFSPDGRGVGIGGASGLALGVIV